MVKRKRKYDEFSEMVTNIIEVLGEERLLEHLIENMSVEARAELIEELHRPRRSEEEEIESIKEYVEGKIQKVASDWSERDEKELRLQIITHIASHPNG